MSVPDVTVVGAGPNGLAAALTCARAGLSVTVIERNHDVGGGCRSAETIESGYLHDTCSAIHPMAFASPFFRELNLSEKIRFVVPDISLAHVSSESDITFMHRDVSRTVAGLGSQSRPWATAFEPLCEEVDTLCRIALSPPIPRAPTGTHVSLAARILREQAVGLFRGGAADLLAGCKAHAIGYAGTPAGAVIGLVLAALGQTYGWPIPIGGSQAITDFLLAELSNYDVSIETGVEVLRLDDLPRSPIKLLDITPRALNAMSSRTRPISRDLKYGPAVTKIDMTLDGPVPWLNDSLAHAGTIHLGGTRANIHHSERSIRSGRDPRQPLIVLSTPATFDNSRAPAGKHVLWAYVHVRAGDPRSQTEYVLSEVERHAPGFRDLVRNVSERRPAELAAHNPNYIDGDISAGATNLLQVLKRPSLSRSPWRTRQAGVYLCSASTSPGPGVHGMCGHLAARQAIDDIL